MRSAASLTRAPPYGVPVNRRTLLAATGGSFAALSGCLTSTTGGGSCGPGDLSAAAVADDYDDYLERNVVFLGAFEFGGDQPWLRIDDSTGTVLAALAGVDLESGTCVALSGTIVTVDGFQSSIDVIESIPNADVYLVEAAITRV